MYCTPTLWAPRNAEKELTREKICDRIFQVSAYRKSAYSGKSQAVAAVANGPTFCWLLRSLQKQNMTKGVF